MSTQPKLVKWLKRLMIFVAFGIVILLVAAWWSLRKPSYAMPQLTLLASQSKALTPKTYTLGTFRVRWSGKDWSKAQLTITHKDNPKHILWQSVAGHGFVSVAQGKETVHESRGSFFIKDTLVQRCRQQAVSSFQHSGQQLTLRGTLLCPDRTSALYQLQFIMVGARQLQFHLSTNAPYNRTYLVYQSQKDEAFFGFGEQFSAFNLKGRRLPIFVMEQGIGRGAQPITWGADLRARSGGDWHTSYAGIPHYITSQLRSMFLESYEYSVFDMRPKHHVEVMLFSSSMRGRILAGQTPLELIEQFTSYTGRMRPLPDWVHNGAVIGMQGGTKKVRKILNILQEKKAPIAAFWLQDWVGQRTTSFGKQLWWNWELDKDHYPQWKKLSNKLKQGNIKTLLYINPFLADVSEKKNYQRNLFKEAKKLGYLVKNQKGQTYMIRNTSFSAALVDLSNPGAVRWLKKVIHKEMISIGASGWMADFGEALPYDSKLMSKRSPAQEHNLYPERWARLNREVTEQAPQGKDIVFFMRSGYTKSPGYSTLFWLGDQLVTWDHYDGIKTAVTGLLSGGLSGYSLNHSDIGGYTTITHPIRNYHRSQELHMRWAELSAFNVMYRTHEGNRPNKNHQFHSSPKTLNHFVRMAKVYKAWAPYRKKLVMEAATKGYPVARHPFLHYPNDRTFHNMPYQQFMLGSKWMVAPVLDPGQTSVKVYLPKGQWVHLWSGKTYGNPQQGTHITIQAPLGQPAMFYLSNSTAGKAFREALKKLNLTTI